MTERTINNLHDAALNAAEVYAKEHGGSAVEDVAYGRGFKSGAFWYRDNVWHEATEKPSASVLAVVCTNGRTIWMSMPYEVREDDLWAYVEDLVPAK